MTSLKSSNGIKQPQLADYTFTVKIGQGSYASVYKAFKKTGQREVVAVKCISKTSLNSVSKENLLTEIELLKTLKHKHIIQLKDFMWDENYVYLIMEYCGGGDLSSYLKKYRVIPENVLRMFLQQLATALQFMRSKLVSHMDLKPSNILLTSCQNPILKIGDFGFAHYLDGETEALHLRGSLLYMAPEIVTLRQYNEKADLWSVGVILYECLFGKAPFLSSSMKELELKITSQDSIRIPTGTSVSSPCRHFLTRLLQRDPDTRMGYDEFFADPFLDLDHLGSGDLINKATELIHIAIAKDSEKDHQAAITYYCLSVEHFMSAIKYTDDLEQKKHLKAKVNEYINRAEELKNNLNPESSGTTEQGPNHSHNPYTDLLTLCQGNEVLMSALSVIKSAMAKDTAEYHESALERYETGLGILLKCLQDESPGRRKELLLSKMSLWMSRAEYLKQYLTIKELKSKTQSSEEDLSSKSNMCSIQ